MYLLGLVNSAFETRRPTGNLELVDLSLEKKYHPPELPVAKRKERSNGHSQSSRMIDGIGNGTHTKMENANNNSSNDSNSNNSNNSNSSNNGATLKHIARKPSRRPSLEDLPADLYMEPLPPLRSKSPNKARHRSSWVPEETPVNWLQQDLASGRQEFEQEWCPFCIGNPSKDIRRKSPTYSWTSTFESVFADGGISIRVEHHPLESSTTEEEEDEDEDASEASNSRDSISVSPELCEEIAENANVNDPSDEGFARMSQQLESVENDEPGELPSTQTEAKSTISSRELGIEQPEVQDFKGVPIAAPPRSSKLGEEARADLAKLPSLSPSLSSPVMEKMEALAASLESTYSWIQPKLAKTGVQRDLPERGSRYSIPKGDDLVQEELSFRLWECEETPQRSESQDEQDSARNGFPTSNGVGDNEILKKQSPRNVDALVNLRTLDVRSRRSGPATTPSKVIPPKVEVDSEQDYPSPSSFTCGLSPTSLFSDDQEPFRSSISSSDDNMFSSFQPVRSRGSCEEIRNGFRKSPRSVLSQEPDEISCETSDSSETSGKKKKHHQKQQQTPSAFTYLYNDESSDLESPMHAKFRHQLQQPFPAFTYSVGKDMGVTSASSSSSSSSSEADGDESVVAGSLQELGFFQEANDLEPWLVHDGGVLYNSEDLEFLLSPNSKWKDTANIVPVPEASSLRSLQRRIGFPSLTQTPTSEEMAESTDGKTKHGSLRAKHDSLKTKHGNPRTKHDSPKTQQESPKTQHDSPKTKLDSPKTQQESPKTQHDSPKIKHDSPKTKQASPKIKHDSPKTQQESPKIKHDSPKTQQESPKIKHDILRRSTSENKWVPYVTSSLHGNNPPRVRNLTRGGSLPDNPNFDKTTYQGKASVTKSSTDKTPKRTVNFAPDLVKEIPYSQSINPATATATHDRKHHHHHHHQPRANPNVQKTKQEEADMDPFVAPPSKVKSKTWEAEAEVEEGPSIMNSRRRWRRNRDGEEDSKAKSSLGSGGSTSWSFSESRFFRNRERVGMPSCVGRLISWPRRFAVKVKSSSRIVDSDDDVYGGGDGGGERSFAGERSFGNSSRRDAELVRRILKGSHKKYSNLSGEDILNDDFERL